MPSLEEIEHFLFAFRSLKCKHGIVFFPRERNFRALLECEISPEERERVISCLKAQHYCKGPNTDGLIPGRACWEFGDRINGMEICIQLSLGLEDGAVFCLSFCRAVQPIVYPHQD